MLTGVLPPSGGDAVMVGESIRTPGGMNEIRSNMGVCPQFDILWQELTAREHMVLFGFIKGLATRELVFQEADALLKEVCSHGDL
jgi:ABC-type multidrug transport system ATPase subunit